jgi:hypothetical protein
MVHSETDEDIRNTETDDTDDNRRDKVGVETEKNSRHTVGKTGRSTAEVAS